MAVTSLFFDRRPWGEERNVIRSIKYFLDISLGGIIHVEYSGTTSLEIRRVEWSKWRRVGSRIYHIFIETRFLEYREDASTCLDGADD